VEGAIEKSSELELSDPELSDPELGKDDDEPVDPVDVAA
jgi:hypothetical protein